MRYYLYAFLAFVLAVEVVLDLQSGVCLPACLPACPPACLPAAVLHLRFRPGPSCQQVPSFAHMGG